MVASLNVEIVPEKIIDTLIFDYGVDIHHLDSHGNNVFEYIRLNNRYYDENHLYKYFKKFLKLGVLPPTNFLEFTDYLTGESMELLLNLEIDNKIKYTHFSLDAMTIYIDMLKNNVSDVKSRLDKR